MGKKLLGELSSATGLPKDLVHGELEKLVVAAGKTTQDLTLEDLREILANYVQDVLVEAKGTFGADARKKETSEGL